MPINHAVFPGALQRHGQALVALLEEYPDDFGSRPVMPGPAVQESRGGCKRATTTG